MFVFKAGASQLSTGLLLLCLAVVVAAAAAAIAANISSTEQFIVYTWTLQDPVKTSSIDSSRRAFNEDDACFVVGRKNLSSESGSLDNDNSCRGLCVCVCVCGSVDGLCQLRVDTYRWCQDGD